jgi:hypothetical protein
MKSKHYTIYIFSIFFFTQILYSQNIDQQKAIVNDLITAVNQSSYASIENHLAHDFTIAGQKGATARIVLKQLINQLNDKIVGFNFLDQENKDNLILNYVFNYESLGEKRAFFIFNNENKITEMSL